MIHLILFSLPIFFGKDLPLLFCLHLVEPKKKKNKKKKGQSNVCTMIGFQVKLGSTAEVNKSICGSHNVKARHNRHSRHHGIYKFRVTAPVEGHQIKEFTV